MIENGVINILANPSDINAYTMAPCCIWNMPYSSAATFRYDSDTDNEFSPMLSLEITTFSGLVTVIGIQF